MSAKHTFKYDESRFKPKQREAAMALVEYEFTPKGQRKSKQEIADELGVTRMTLHKWDKEDANFIAYKNYLASEFADSHLAFVYSKLIDSIGKGSVRAMETFLKRIGDLDAQTEITIKQAGDGGKTFAEREQELLARLGEMQGNDDDKD